MTAATGRRWNWRPDPMTVAVAFLVVLAEVAFLLAYLQASPVGLRNPLVALGVPLVWVNLGLFVFARVRPSPDAGRQWPAVVLAGGYFAVLAVAGGLVTTGPTGAGGARVVLQGVPGWIPLVVVPIPPLSVVIVPFKLVGYLALAYLVYVTVRDASGALVGGLIGLFSCVSCTFPVITAVLSGVAGGGSALAAAAYSNSYLLSTVVFAVTVGLLVWRPGPGSLPAAWPGR